MVFEVIKNEHWKEWVEEDDYRIQEESPSMLSYIVHLMTRDTEITDRVMKWAKTAQKYETIYFINEELEVERIE